MVDSIVLKLRSLASDPTSDVEELLNKALIVSRKLKIKKFRKWCDAELEGYIDQALPDYRKFKGELKVFNPYHGLQPFIIRDDMDDLISIIELDISIGEIMNILKLDGDYLSKELSSCQKEQLKELSGGLNDLEPEIVFYKQQLENILKKVRSIILNWTLKLEEDGILGEGLKFSDKEKEVAMLVNNYNIQNMQGIAGNVSGASTVNQNNTMNISKMNFEDLAQYLMSNKVAFADIKDLKDAVNIDPIPTEPNKLGKNVSDWIGKMIGKSASGSWDIGVSAAGTLLAESISKFYGLS